MLRKDADSSSATINDSGYHAPATINPIRDIWGHRV